MHKTIYLFVLALFFTSTAFAQITWEALNGPTAAKNIQIFAVDQSNRIYLRHEQELLTSTDNGNTWINSSTGIPTDRIGAIYSILVFPSGKVIAQTRISLVSTYYQYNALSNSWSLDIPLTNQSFGTLSFDGQQRLWQAYGQFLSYSTDGGVVFNPILQTDGFALSMANYNDNHNLVAVQYSNVGKVFHFNTDGVSTLVKEIGNNFAYVSYSPYTGAAFLSESSRNWRSMDGGVTWEEIILKINAADLYSTIITNLFYESSAKIWAATGRGIFLSEDGGATWIPFFVEQNQYGISAFRKTDGTLFINRSCSSYGFSRSTDSGQTWESLSYSFKKPNVLQTILAKNDILYAQTCNGYDRSSDGGQTWSSAMIFDSVATRMDNLAVQPDGDLFSISPNQHIIRSVDGGNNWTVVVQPTNLPWAGTSHAVGTDAFGNVYALYNVPGSFRSSDKGQTWQPINFNYFGAFNPKNLLFRSDGDIFQIGTNSSTIRHYIASQDITVSENLGTIITGATINAQDNLILVGALYVGGPPKLYRYTGTGQTQQITSSPTTGLSFVTSAANGLTFLLRHDSIFQSDNIALQWTFTGKLPSTANSTLQNIQIGKDQHLYLSYQGDEVYRSDLALATRKMITGTVFYDGNSNNCSPDANEPAIANRYVEAKATDSYGAYSAMNGQYRIFVPEGTYTLSVQTPNPLFTACPPTAVTVTAQNDTAFADVGLRQAIPCSYLSVNASTPFLRRCFSNTYTVRYANEGSAVAVGATITVTLDSLFEFLSASIPPISQNGQVLTFQVGDLAPTTSGSFQIQVKVSCMASFQQLHCFKAQISPGTPCLPDLPDLSNSEECRANVGSFDPNEKHAFVNGQEDPASILPNQPIEYLINFQNTGTDTAFTVVVEDRIPGILDITSVTPLVSSHPYSIELGPDRNLRFIFNNILLPDSNINEVASHGFIKFAIKQLPNLPSGTAIRNTAAIYFDFNAAVLTDPSELVVTLPTKVYEPEPGYAVQVFPNPFQDLLNFRISGPNTDQSYTLLLMDALGRIAHRERFAGNVLQVSRKNLPTGIYFFTVLGENERRIAAGRVVAE